MKILSLLLDNCRKSDRQIGKKIGISGSAVKSRIQKMVKNGVIEKFALKIEPPALGFNLFYIVVSGQNQESILQQVNLIGKPFLIVPCVGGITVCGIIVSENVEQKIAITKSLMKDIRVLSIFQAENLGITSNLTKTDLVIIDKLIKDPRSKIENIAKSTKLSSKTVTRSLEKFQKADTILFTLIYDPIKLKEYIPYAILVEIKNNFEDTLNHLKRKFSDSFLQKPFIAKNQVVLFMYSDDIFKLDLLTQQVREINGVAMVDLFIPKKINLPTDWIIDTIKSSKNSKKLHLLYQTH
jgi:DNA-binding Lrp family transcriptional regulator